MLRGVNVGGKGRVKMEDLRRTFEAMDFTEVTTYIQSGNVIFSTPDDSAAGLRAMIETRLLSALSLDTTVILRDGDELAALVDSNPFIESEGDASVMKKLHMTFFADTPVTQDVSLDGIDIGRDEFVLRGREVYLNCPDGYGRSKLTNSLWEKRCRVRATTRNWRSVVALARLTAG